MYQRSIRSVLTVFAVAIVSTAGALAQGAVAPSSKAAPASNAWEAARAERSERAELLVVTFDQPRRRQYCWVVYFASEQLLCKRSGGRLRSYFPEQIAALILPGHDYRKLGLPVWSAAFGAAIWGSVAFAATCPACAVATGVVTVLWFGIGGLFMFGDHQPDRLLYVAPGQQLTGKLKSLKFADGLPAPAPGRD